MTFEQLWWADAGWMTWKRNHFEESLEQQYALEQIKEEIALAVSFGAVWAGPAMQNILYTCCPAKVNPLQQHSPFLLNLPVLSTSESVNYRQWVKMLTNGTTSQKLNLFSMITLTSFPLQNLYFKCFADIHTYLATFVLERLFRRSVINLLWQ